MILNYLKTSWRNILRNKMTSLVNISGLAIGLSVAMLIGIWIWDELSFNKYHTRYDRIGQGWQFVSFGAKKTDYNSMPVPLAAELRNKYPEFELVSVASFNRTAVISQGDKKLSAEGMYVEDDFVEMMSVRLLSGSPHALKDIRSVLISESMSGSLFENKNPLHQTIRLNNKIDVVIQGVYEDFPENSSFHGVNYLAPWELNVSTNEYAKRANSEWDENSFQIFTQLKPGISFEKISLKIKDIRMKMENPPGYKPEFFIHPMRKWHLYGHFEDGANVGGLIKTVWLFGIAGVFVLLLACINFMNLSTARSEKRAKEVGIRKTIGSLRSQLINQFFTESVLNSFIGLILALIITKLSFPFFNDVSGKNLDILWNQPIFWLIALSFTWITGMLSGSYPAIYLSSFQPVKVLKGSFNAGSSSGLFRKVLVVFQFTVSVVLMIGTGIVYRQIQYARDRDLGYNKAQLIEINMLTPELIGHYEALRSDLLNTGAVADMAKSEGSITTDYGGTTNISWKGKPQDSKPLVIANRVTYDYGKTIQWKVDQGRDFSRDFASDSSSIILNQAAAKLMNLTNPLSEVVQFSGRSYNVIGIVHDMIKDDPFKAINPSIFLLNNSTSNMLIRIKPNMDLQASLKEIEHVFKKHDPSSLFDYKFVDESFEAKFINENRIARLAGFFAFLAIFISCLGVFGLVSFMAEQRIKEIGIRKVLGASVSNLWQLLTRDFILLVFISLIVATPLAYYLMHGWLSSFEYRIEISWKIFIAVAFLTIFITLITVSFQALQAAVANPLKNLRNE